MAEIIKDETIIKSNDKKEKRIVKRSKSRIAIIITIIVLLLAALGVGIYFIVKSFDKKPYVVDGVEMNADIGDVRDDVLDGDNNVGVFFYEEDEATANYLMMGDTTYDDGENGTGVLSSWMIEQTDNEERTWYGVEIPSDNNLAAELFTTKADDEFEEYILYDEFEYLAGMNGSGGTNSNGDVVDPWYVETADASILDSNETLTLEDQIASDFRMTVQTNDYDDEDRDVLVTTSNETTDGGDSSTDGGDGTTDGSDGTTTESSSVFYENEDGSTDGSTSTANANVWDVVSGTTMWFDGNSSLEAIINGYALPPQDETSSYESDYYAAYQDWFEEIEER